MCKCEGTCVCPFTNHFITNLRRTEKKVSLLLLQVRNWDVHCNLITDKLLCRIRTKGTPFLFFVHENHVTTYYIYTMYICADNVTIYLSYIAKETVKPWFLVIVHVTSTQKYMKLQDEFTRWLLLPLGSIYTLSRCKFNSLEQIHPAELSKWIVFCSPACYVTTISQEPLNRQVLVLCIINICIRWIFYQASGL